MSWRPSEEIEAPKLQDKDCALVTTTAPLNLSHLECQLFEWARRDRVDALRAVVDSQKCNLNVQDNFNRTPLHFAASNGNLSTVKLLVQSRAVIDVTDKYGITPLMWAVYNNHKKVAVYLIESGAKYTKVTKQGHTIIHFIAESNALGILKFLYHKYRILKIDEEDNSGLTPFLVAAHRGNQLLLEVFVKQRCNIVKKDKRQRSALHLASWKGHTNVVAYLLSIEEIVGIIDDLDSEEKSALYLAVESNHQEVLKLLLGAKANVNLRLESRDCALIEASRNGFHSCIDTLLLHGADKDIRTKVGNSALHVAVLANLPESVYFLLSRGFDLHACNTRGQTPLHLAVEQNKLESVEALLLVGARLDITDNDGFNPLEVAARASYTTFVDMIIKAERWRKRHPDRADCMRSRLLSIPGFTSSQIASTFDGRFSPQLHDRRHYDRVDAADRPSSMWSAANYSDQRRSEMNRAQSSICQSAVSTLSPRTTRSLRTPLQGSIYTGTNSSVLEAADHEMSSFVDPYEMFPMPPEQVLTTEPITPRNSSTLHSISGSDELSLGFEASRIWESGRALGNKPNISSSRHGQPTQLTSARGVIAGLEMPNEDVCTLGNYQEHILPNGEVLVTLGDGAPMDDKHTMSDTRPSLTTEVGYFSLITYSQPYAEEMKVLLFELSHKYLKADEWKRLAHHWEFEEQHIAAIEYQDTGKNAYKDHGYRLMSIWLHGIEPNVSALNEVYEALIGIDQTKLAKKLRARVEMTKRKKKGCRVQ